VQAVSNNNLYARRGSSLWPRDHCRTRATSSDRAHGAAVKRFRNEFFTRQAAYCTVMVCAIVIGLVVFFLSPLLIRSQSYQVQSWYTFDREANSSKLVSEDWHLRNDAILSYRLHTEALASEDIAALLDSIGQFPIESADATTIVRQILAFRSAIAEPICVKHVHDHLCDLSYRDQYFDIVVGFLNSCDSRYSKAAGDRSQFLCENATVIISRLMDVLAARGNR
jgi:hypothetical protein